MRTTLNVLLRTLDVRQIQREVLRKRKAPGMESNESILHGKGTDGQPSFAEWCVVSGEE